MIKNEDFQDMAILKENQETEQLLKTHGDDIKKFNFFQKLSFEMSYTINLFYENEKNKNLLFWFILSVLFHLILNISIFFKFYFAIIIPFAILWLIYLVKFIKEFNILEILGIIFQIAVLIIFSLQKDFLLYPAIVVLIYELILLKVHLSYYKINLYHRIKIVVSSFYLFYGIHFLAHDFEVYIVFLLTAVVLGVISFFSFLSMFKWMWKSFIVIKKWKYPKGEKYGYDPFHKDGSVFILLKFSEVSFEGYYFYFLIFLGFSFSYSIISLYVFPAVILLGYLFWLINFIFFLITALPKRLIILSEDRIEESFYANPFFRENLKKAEDFIAKKCRICENQYLTQLYECGHIFSCFNCWNDNRNVDYRDCCMICKQKSKTIKKINHVNHMYFISDTFRI